MLFCADKFKMSGENFNTFEGEFVGQAQNCDSPRYREEFVVNAKMAHIEEKYNGSFFSLILFSFRENYRL